ncbi:MAG: NHLP bacteriocin system secretion protein [Alphaproteobacteria bacterium]|nr:NHLP bacteriocin system secretion protein [Alphaproteobacteria bacterium]MBV8412991.1 NHLP bacteriocin system secretion protein [Alphaproteobacteria bacterium]
MAEQVLPMPEQHGSLFRAEALSRFYSCEQLDQRVNLISPAMRMIVTSLALIVVSGLVWAVLGEVPTRVIGRGVLLADGKAAHPVQPVVAGALLELLVHRGEHVTVGAPIARVQQVSLETQLTSTEMRVTALQEDLAQLKRANAVESAKIDAMLQRQKEAVAEMITAGKARAQGLNDILVADESLFQRGLVNRLELAQARAAHDQTLQDVVNAHARAVEIEALADRKRDALAETERLKQEDIDALQAQAARLRAELTIGSAVKAPISGVIEEVRVGLGDVVSPGTTIATIGRISPESFEVIALFSSDMAKRIKPGMDVHIHPVSVRKEEHGTMRGRMIGITELGVSEAELNAILRNPQLTHSLMGDGSPLMGKVEVFLDKSTPSGFAWWGGRGPPFTITRGTHVDVDVIVERRRPIALVIPALRELLGLEG